MGKDPSGNCGKDPAWLPPQEESLLLGLLTERGQLPTVSSAIAEEKNRRLEDTERTVGGRK
jgi:hypothetical protein